MQIALVSFLKNLTFWQFFKIIIEIGILWLIFYTILLYVRGSRAVQLLKGVIILVIFFFVIQRLELNLLTWIFTKFFTISVMALLIIFQPELRRGLTRIGQNPMFNLLLKEEKIIDEIVKASVSLSKKKIGALIAIEREIGLKPYIESGISIDAQVTAELISTIFMPNTPLHDGGIIVERDRIVAAGCLFPLSQSPKLSKILGTRHRAAVGLTEETDSAVVVISEETGATSIAFEGKLTRDLDQESLFKFLKNIFKLPRQKSNILDLFKR